MGIGFPGIGINLGEVASPLPLSFGDNIGELRLQSDFSIARDNRTACFWQGFINEQDFMSQSFKAAFANLALVGQNKDELVDCSDVVPLPKPPLTKPASFPATKDRSDIQQSCVEPFPSLSVDRKWRLCLTLAVLCSN